MSTQAKVNDVVQIDPNHSAWGPVFVVVTEVKDWGIQGYFLVPQRRDQPPGVAYIRVEHAHYVIIGQAEWALGQ